MWHGRLPLLSGVNRCSPWAENPAEGAVNLLESARGAFFVDWQLPVGLMLGGFLLRLLFGLMGALLRTRCLEFLHLVRFFLLVVLAVFGLIVDGDNLMMMWVTTWPLVLAVAFVLFLVRCRLFRRQSSGELFLHFKLLVTFTLVSITLAVRHVDRLLDGSVDSRPPEIVKGGDLILLRLGGLDTVRITKVKGHADEVVVRDGRVRELDRVGDNAADDAAVFGRRWVLVAVIDARRNVALVCGRWYPVLLTLQVFYCYLSGCS